MKSYPKAKDTPSRKLRKSLRSSVFQLNRKATKLAKRPRTTLGQRDR